MTNLSLTDEQMQLVVLALDEVAEQFGRDSHNPELPTLIQVTFATQQKQANELKNFLINISELHPASFLASTF